jgi:hypothetical protein
MIFICERHNSYTRNWEPIVVSAGNRAQNALSKSKTAFQLFKDSHNMY